MLLQGRSAEKSRIEKCHRVAVPNVMWLQGRGATQNKKLNSPPDHNRSLPTLIMPVNFSSILIKALIETKDKSDKRNHKKKPHYLHFSRSEEFSSQPPRERDLNF
jgi:hypothetical protein